MYCKIQLFILEGQHSCLYVILIQVFSCCFFALGPFLFYKLVFVLDFLGRDFDFSF